uniref:Uncharacterized protein n=1 Tax=Anguilla anguilla TaxID=7936 RepID=A0A0E9Q2L1_ANGAN
MVKANNTVSRLGIYMYCIYNCPILLVHSEALPRLTPQI